MSDSVYPRIKKTLMDMAMKLLPVQGFRLRMSIVTANDLLSEFSNLFDEILDKEEAVSKLVGLPVDLDGTMERGEMIFRWEIKV